MVSSADWGGVIDELYNEGVNIHHRLIILEERNLKIEVEWKKI